MSFCTASAERAASYLLFLRNKGDQAVAQCINGNTHSLTTLTGYAASLRQVLCSSH